MSKEIRHYKIKGYAWWYCKDYPVACLISEYKQRIEIINSLPSYVTPPTTFEEADDVVRYKQLMIQRMNIKTSNIPGALLTLGRDIDILSKTGFIHGDINQKNVIYDGKKYRLIDIEPSLIQIRDGQVVLMSTMPFMALDDYRSKAITINTDKVSFAFFCLYQLKIPVSRTELKKTINNNKSIIELVLNWSEYELCKMSFEDIGRRVFEKYKISL